MKKHTSTMLLKPALLAVAIASSQGAIADEFTEALTGGKAFGDIRLRYESVEQDNALKDADALIVRTRLGYTTGGFKNFSATLEIEDSSVIGDNDYNGITEGDSSYSVIADPETTEVDQAFIQYKTDMGQIKYGRQVIAWDNQRFIGHVGWRNDRQTFTGLSAAYTEIENLTVSYAYIFERNRILAEEADIDSRDHLLNVGYKTSLGKVSAYAYLLEQDDATALSFDTYGVRFTGTKKSDDITFHYAAEYATQEKSAKGTSDQDADYLKLEGGITISGITAKLGYEVLGSDSGAYGFSTPLATGHKFNGWADQFLGTPNEGLQDTYVSVGGSAFGGRYAVIYHDYEADESSATVDDLGDEWNLVYSKKFGKHYSAGVKYAKYDAGDIKVDTDKLWVWAGIKF
jgi:hypothetical protein